MASQAAGLPLAHKRQGRPDHQQLHSGSGLRSLKPIGMSDTQQPWKRIQDKLQQLVQQHQVLQKDNDRLLKEVRELKARDVAQAKKIDELEIKVAALKTATGQLDDADKKELDKRLHQYIRDVDRCIAMLSQ